MKIITRGYVFLCIVLLSVSQSGAVDLKGTVTNAAAKSGQKGIIVTAVEHRSGINISSETDYAGEFEIKGLKKGARYNIRASYSGNGTILPKEGQITIESRDIEGYNYSYYPRYGVSGRVSSDVIDKVSGLAVVFRSQEPFYDYQSATVDGDGFYSLELLYDQQYDIYVTSVRQLYGDKNNASIRVLSGENKKDIKIVPVYYAVGRVFEAGTGTGLSDITITAVSIESDGAGKRFSAEVNADGYYVLSGLYYGENYKVTVTHNLPGSDIKPLETETGIIKSTITNLNFPVVNQ